MKLVLNWSELGLVTKQPLTGQTGLMVIESLEHQLNDATQQLTRLRAVHAPGATEEQLTTQQSQTNEQPEPLQGECQTLFEATAKVVAERDIALRNVDTF